MLPGAAWSSGWVDIVGEVRGSQLGSRFEKSMRNIEKKIASKNNRLTICKPERDF